VVDFGCGPATYTKPLKGYAERVLALTATAFARPPNHTHRHAIGLPPDPRCRAEQELALLPFTRSPITVAPSVEANVERRS
jgi:hypothetical protein